MYSKWEGNDSGYAHGDSRFYTGLVATTSNPSNYYSGESRMNPLYSPYCEKASNAKLFHNDGYYVLNSGEKEPIIMDRLSNSSELTSYSNKNWLHPGPINSGLVIHLKN